MVEQWGKSMIYTVVSPVSWSQQGTLLGVTTECVSQTRRGVRLQIGYDLDKVWMYSPKVHVLEASCSVWQRGQEM
jgi:hypothetical protein